MRQMPEGLPDERRGQQRKPKAQKRHGVHPVLCMHQGLSQKSAALKRCKPYITVNPIYKKNYGTRKHRSFFMFSFTGISKSICRFSRFPNCAKFKHGDFQFYPNAVRKRVVSDIVRTMAPSAGRYFGLRPRTAKLNNPET